MKVNVRTCWLAQPRVHKNGEDHRWLDHLKVLSWHPSIAVQKGIKSVCCRDHLRVLVGHWLTQASLRFPSATNCPSPIGSDPNLQDADLGSHSVGRLLGELSVYRDSFSREWSGSAESLECIIDTLTGVSNWSPVQNQNSFDLPHSAHEVSCQPGAAGV